MNYRRCFMLLIIVFGFSGFLSVAHAQSLDCSRAVDLGCVTSVTVSGDTTGRTSSADAYNCVTWTETGPEAVYIIRPDGTGDITAILTMMSADFDIFILSACDEDTCIGFGNTSATLAAAPPGTYYIVVDGYDGAEGTFRLTVLMNCVSTPTPTPTGTWYSPTPTFTPTPTLTPTRTNTPTYTSTPSLTSTPTPSPTPPVHSLWFCDGFESGNLFNWGINGGGSGSTPYVAADTTLSGGLTPHGGSWVAYLGDSTAGGYATSTMDLVMNLAGETSVQLDFWWVTYGLESDHWIYLDLYDGTWHLAVVQYQSNRWQHQSIDLDASYSMIDGFIVRFRSYQDYTEGSDACYVDDVCVYNPLIITVTPPPTATGTPTPTPTRTNTPTATVSPTITETPTITPTFRPNEMNPAVFVATLCPTECEPEHVIVSLERAPLRADVMFSIDLTGSMGGILSTAKANSIDIMNELRAIIPDTNFGLISYMDYPSSYSFCGYSSTYGSAGLDWAYKLEVPLTTATTTVSTAINALSLGAGADGPESYVRVLYESYADSANIGWRGGIAKILIDFGDNLPHDCDVLAITGGTMTTGIDPGRDATAGTADDIEILPVLAEMAANNIILVRVNNYSYLDEWKAWAAITGGEAFDFSSIVPADLARTLRTIVSRTIATISRLTLITTPGYETWLSSVTPAEYTGIVLDRPLDFDFDVEWCVPAGTPPGTYNFQLIAVGDGIYLAVQDVTIRVPTPSECDCTDPTTIVLDFETGMPGWDISSNGGVTWAITDTEARSGTYSLKTNPSTCGAGCYGDFAVFLDKSLAGMDFENATIEFWLRTDTFFGGATQVYVNGGSTLLGTFEPVGRTWTYFSVNYNAPVNDVLFYFLDLPNSNSVFIDDIKISGTCKLATPTPTMTPVCPAPAPVYVNDSFESGFGGWAVRSEGGVSYGLTADSHTGTNAFKVDRSGCPYHCYGNTSVTLTKVFTKPLCEATISFWSKTEMDIGSYIQVIIYDTENGSRRILTVPPRGTGWEYHEIDYVGRIYEVRIYFVDITSTNAAIIDDVVIDGATCATSLTLFASNQ